MSPSFRGGEHFRIRRQFIGTGSCPKASKYLCSFGPRGENSRLAACAGPSRHLFPAISRLWQRRRWDIPFRGASSSLQLLFSRAFRRQRRFVRLHCQPQINPSSESQSWWDIASTFFPSRWEPRRRSSANSSRECSATFLAAQDHASFTIGHLLDDTAANKRNRPLFGRIYQRKEIQGIKLRQCGFTVDYDDDPKAYESV